jgi:hypothetical protein
MNAGLEATTALSSVSDILSFRGAQNLLKQWDAEGDAKNRWEAIGDLDHNKENGLELRRGYDYIDPMAILERGLTPELFHTQMQMIGGVEKNRAGRVEQMRNIYGLNYTGAAALDQTYQDKLKTFKGDKKEADDYFSGEEWKKTLENFKENREFMSTELKQLSITEDIAKYTYEIGQWHLDKKIPEMEKALNKEWLEALIKGVTTDPREGQHKDPFSDPESGKREDKSFPGAGKPLGGILETPFDFENATPRRLREEAATLEGQGKPGLARSYRDEADNRESLLIRDINAATEIATSHLFSEHIGDKTGFWPWERSKSEKPQMNAIKDTIGNALISGDYEQFDAAREISETLYRYGKDEKTGKPYNMADAFNSLADFENDIMGMLNALRSFTKETEDAAERINKLQATLEIQD